MNLPLSAPAPALGVAYAAVNPHHTLNVLGHMMGGRTDADTDGLVRWAAPRLGRTANELRMAYLPRQLYGTYLRDLLAQAVAAAPDRIALHHGEAIDIEPIGASGFW
ncbi:MAG: FAD/NAD(P)-binding protein, partial [Alphaproteobacteria bacterium]|nr:FAD/NAD(P)-binding protein [Alphaproteobacteria bacterium]